MQWGQQSRIVAIIAGDGAATGELLGSARSLLRDSELLQCKASTESSISPSRREVGGLLRGFSPQQPPEIQPKEGMESSVKLERPRWPPEIIPRRQGGGQASVITVICTLHETRIWDFLPSLQRLKQAHVFLAAGQQRENKQHLMQY